jgi:hypothetical protein
METLINKEIKKECKIFGFKAENITIESKEINNFTFIVVHYDINTSKWGHRYMLLCVKNSQIIYKTSNVIDKNYFYLVNECVICTRNYFKSVSASLNKLKL